MDLGDCLIETKLFFFPSRPVYQAVKCYEQRINIMILIGHG